MSRSRTHYRTCNLCEAMCGLEIELVGDELRSIRGDKRDVLSQGHICPKATALKDIYEDPDRLRRPVRRVGNGWEELHWYEALEEAAQRIHDIQERHGRDAVGLYLGNPNAHNFGTLVYGPVFLRTLGSKNRFSASSCDQWPLMLASYTMLGHQLLFPIPDIDRTSFMMLIGANPLASNGSIMAAPGAKKRLTAIRRRGGKVLVVDPRRTETAACADEHLFIRPGTDALFLMSLLHEVCAAGAKLGRLADCIRNAEPLIEQVQAFSPDVTEAWTGIPASTVRRIAKEFRSAPRAVAYGRVGACTQDFGGLSTWLINVLNIVTANFDEPGGAMFSTPAIDTLAEIAGFGIGAGSHGRWKSRIRGLPEFSGELPSAVMAEEILSEDEDRIRAMVTLAGNPILSTPNGGQLDRAFEKLDFNLAIDFYINETTRHADLILPPISPVERSHYDLALYLTAVRNTAKYSPPIFERRNDELDDWQILSELNCRLLRLRHGKGSRPYLTACALHKAGPERVLDLGLRLGPYGKKLRPWGRGLSLRKLKQSPHGLDLGPLQRSLPCRLPEGHKFIDLAPEIFVEDLKRLRSRYFEAESSNAQLLLIGRRQLRSNNSWMHNSERLMRGKPRCTLMMHPADAERLGIADGAQVEIRSRVGAVVAPVQVTDEVMVGVVSLPHGFGHGRDGVRLSVARQHAGVSLNDLTDDQELDQVSGNAVLNGVPVSVTAVTQSAAQ